MVRARRSVGGLLTLVLAGVVVPMSGQSRSTGAPLARAARTDDVAAMKSLVARRVNVNEQEGDGSTALLWATYHSNDDAARLLLNAGAKPNLPNRLGVTPLLVACRLGDLGMITALVNGGADPKLTYLDGETPLMAAAGSGSAEAVKLLIARGVDVNAMETERQQTALMWAASSGHIAVVDALLAAGADVNRVATPSTLARHKNDGTGGRMQVDHPGGGLTAVMFAAREGHIEIARRLADAGANLNHVNPDGMTALVVAVLNDRLDLAALLLDKGASVDDSALYEAVQQHNLLANALAGEATRPRPNNPNTTTPLDLMRRLLDRGANPNRMATHTLHLDGTGTPAAVNETPLYRAVAAQDVEAVRLMMAKGGDATSKGNAAGQMPLAAALGGGAGAGRNAFFQTGASAFRFETQRNMGQVLTVMLEAGADVNARAANGDTPLHMAAQSGNLTAIQALADRGAKLDARNDAGFTALDVASGRGGRGTIPGPAGDAQGRAGGRGGGPGVGGGQAQAAALLRQLMGLPAEPATAGPPQQGPPTSAPAAGRGGAQ